MSQNFPTSDFLYNLMSSPMFLFTHYTSLICLATTWKGWYRCLFKNSEAGRKVLDLSSNNFNGSMQLDSVQQLKNLSTLVLSFNNLLIQHNGINSFVFPQISTLKLSSNILKTFLDFLRSQSLLLELDLSYNQIHRGDT